MCEIYDLGPECFTGDIDLYIKGDQYEWIVCYYENYDGYSGGGEIVALRKDGLLEFRDLAHCSCYGPLEEWGTNTPMTIEEYLRPKNSIHDFAPGEVVDAKVRELLGVA